MAQRSISRRDVLASTALWFASVAAGAPSLAPGGEVAGEQLSALTLAFIRRCAKADGGYAPSPDPTYSGNSDTASSDLAAVTYAAVLARTMAWKLADVDKSARFVHAHQKPDGSFVNLSGKIRPDDPLAVLYNTTQATVALRAMGQRPTLDPAPVMARFFQADEFKKLPWYTTSFFPLFYAAMGRPLPEPYEQALTEHLIANQKADGYIQDHVAATFHMAHFFRLIGKPTPRAAEMVARTLHDQKPDGGWNIKDPDWDVHACFDALFILRQLGRDAPRVRAAIARGGAWALRCHNEDGGFGHYPGRHSDMDAVYFNFGSLIQAGMVRTAPLIPADAKALGWGHAITPPVAAATSH